MGKIIGYTFEGGVIGAFVAICLFIVGGCIELLNFGCAILTCDCDSPKVFDWSGAGAILFLCVIGGAIIGAFYGVYKVKQERDAEIARKREEASEEAKKQRIKWAEEIKQKATDVSVVCTTNKTMDIPLVSVSYKATAQMDQIINELTNAAEKQGKIDSLVEELSKRKGGILS